MMNVELFDIEITLRGRTPLLLHRFTDEAAMRATSGENSGKSRSSADTPRQQAERFLYVDANGTPIMPTTMIYACFLDAGKFFKVGKKQVSTRDHSLLAGALEMHEIEVPIIHAKPWEVDIRAIRNEVTKARMLSFRPRFDDWAATVNVTLDHTIVPVGMFRDIVDLAGRVSGLGSYRPGCKGTFGKFVVDKWEQVRLAQEEAA